MDSDQSPIETIGVNPIGLKPMRMPARVPRYTSYPTADRFSTDFTAADFIHQLRNRSFTGNPLALYLHIPFCQSLCYYCGCNKKVTQRKDLMSVYVDALLEEINSVADTINGNKSVMQVHFGGGTPNFLEFVEIQRIVRHLKQHFHVAQSVELSMEVDPRLMDRNKAWLLADHEFNRISLGIQDFDPEVQKAINRIQSVEWVSNTIQELRSAGITSLNFDLILGLPLQTAQKFSTTVDHVVEMHPSRIALYNYAHLPERFKAQRLIDPGDLPARQERAAMRSMTIEKLTDAGYLDIGMDHFALPDDELALAYNSGRLHRNFQGYTTHAECDSVGFGCSAISRVGSCYSQNEHSVSAYCRSIQSGELATVKGIKLSRDDALRRSLITTLMCHGRIDKRSLEIAHLIDFDQYFREEIHRLKVFEKQGHIELKSDAVQVTKEGVQANLQKIASVFDAYLQRESVAPELIPI